jgi:hypothetical protein
MPPGAHVTGLSQKRSGALCAVAGNFVYSSSLSLRQQSALLTGYEELAFVHA